MFSLYLKEWKAGHQRLVKTKLFWLWVPNQQPSFTYIETKKKEPEGHCGFH